MNRILLIDTANDRVGAWRRERIRENAALSSFAVAFV